METHHIGASTVTFQRDGMEIDGKKIDGFFAHRRITFDSQPGRLRDLGHSVVFTCAANRLPHSLITAFGSDCEYNQGSAACAFGSLQILASNPHYAAALAAITMSSDDMYYCCDDADQPVRQLYAYTDACRAKYGLAPMAEAG